jgi:hypothetical protein
MANVLKIFKKEILSGGCTRLFFFGSPVGEISPKNKTLARGVAAPSEKKNERRQ